MTSSGGRANPSGGGPAPVRVALEKGVVAGLDAGHGSPAVVFIGGAGGMALSWAPVLTRVAEVTRAFAYDRPGYGSSNRARAEALTSPAALAEELVAVLDAVGLTAPVVLVAHSFGGFIARSFAAAHPERLAGMVLIDAVHEDEWTAKYPDAHRRGLRLLGKTMNGLAAAATIGLPQLLARLPFVPLGAVDQLPEPYRTQARRAGTRRTSLRTAATEFASLESAAREMTATGPLGDLPLVVVAHGRPGPTAPGVTAAEATQLEELAQQSQADLCGLSTSGRLVRAGTGHEVHIEDPGLVAGEIVQLLRDLPR